MNPRYIVAQIPKDKWVHFVKGQLVFITALFITGHMIASFLIAVFASIIVEFYQYITLTGEKETSDIMSDMAGALVGCIIYAMPNFSLNIW